jgi:hypothetical protein
MLQKKAPRLHNEMLSLPPKTKNILQKGQISILSPMHQDSPPERTQKGRKLSLETYKIKGHGDSVGPINWFTDNLA